MIKMKDLVKPKRVWSAVVLSPTSTQTLLSTFANEIPAGWETIAHHMTIDPFGPLKDASQHNTAQKLQVTHIGKSDKAVAVKVSGYTGKTNNSFPHVTLAVNRSGGGKPKDSNQITDWVVVPSPVGIDGTIQNIEN